MWNMTHLYIRTYIGCFPLRLPSAHASDYDTSYLIWLVDMLNILHSYVGHDSFVYVWHDSSICVTWLHQMRAITHSHVWNDSFIILRIWLRHVCGDMDYDTMTQLYMCDMTHSYVWHDAFKCVGFWSMWRHGLRHHILDSQAHGWSDSCICVTWPIHMCDMTHTYVWRDSSICVTWFIYMCDMTHP